MRPAWRIARRHPELRRPFRGTIAGALRRNPRALEPIPRTVIASMHRDRFARRVVGEIDARVAAVDAGTRVEPLPLAGSHSGRRGVRSDGVRCGRARREGRTGRARTASRDAAGGGFPRRGRGGEGRADDLTGRPAHG